MRRLQVPGFALLLAAAVALAASGSVGAVAGARTKSAGGIVLPVPVTTFGGYKLVPLVPKGSKAYAGPATPHSLQKVALVKLDRAQLKLVKALAPALQKNGFAVVHSGSSLFANEYEGNIYGGYPVYVTTDAAYNAWHNVFDKTLRDLEQQVLSPKLGQMLTRLIADAGTQARALKGTPLAGAASRAQQLYQLAAAELGMNVPLGPLAAQEKALIASHSGQHTSPITGTTIDYSLFTPRGHYTMNAALTRFFLSMSALGQLAFCLPGTASCNGVEPTRVGIVATSLVSHDHIADGLWHQIYEPTAFLVGTADDYTPDEVAAALSKAAGSKGVRALGSDAAVRKVVAALTAARKVQIDPNRASIRVMGTRFTLDGFILDQLLYPNVGTSAKPRLLPSGLDVASVFGSKFAAAAATAEGKTAYANYGSQVKALQSAVAERPAKEWGGTVYDAWLYALQPMFAPHGAAFPDYMRTNAWAGKDVQTGLGSYTELKHDTILFTKQPVAEAGGNPVVATPLNWVEPDPAAFGRLQSVATLTQKGLAARGLLTREARGLLSSDIALFGFLERIATAELAGKPTSAADNKKLRSMGDLLASLWWRTAIRSIQAPQLPAMSALIADVAASPKGTLELADGEIDTIFVIVPGAKKGTFELARGGVYSYYEFTSPPGVRLNDTQWRALIQTSKAPPRPPWQAVFRVPCPPTPKAEAKSDVGCSLTDRPG